MDGTLLDLHFDNYFWHEYLPKKWGEKNNLGLEAAKEALMPGFYKWAGTLSWYCLDHWSDHLDMDILKLKEDIGHLIKERPGSLAMLKYLTSINKRMALVTNAHAGLINMKFNASSIGDYFDDVFCSHDFGFPKEDPQFWEELQKTYPFEPQTTLLIDDNTNVLHSAKKYGIKHLLSIAQPDLSQAPRFKSDFPMIKSFVQLMSGK